MLAIRMQRVGRKGLPQYRLVVQDSRRTPVSGRIVETLGSYNPHTKETKLNKELSQKFINDGAQPSDRVVAIFKTQGVKLPKWVEVPTQANGKTRNPAKLRKNQPKEDSKTE